MSSSVRRFALPLLAIATSACGPDWDALLAANGDSPDGAAARPERSGAAAATLPLGSSPGLVVPLPDAGIQRDAGSDGGVRLPKAR
jgi:hypothetical protein